MKTKDNYFAFTHRGLGPFVAQEITEKFPEAKLLNSPLSDGILFSVNASKQELNSLRSVHRVYRHLGFIEKLTESWDFEEIVASLYKLEYNFIDAPFRLTVKRHNLSGDLGFKTVDIERAVVKHIEQKHNAEFSLREYQINIGVDLFENYAHVGVYLSDKDLTKRFNKPYNFTNAIKTNIAYVMCRLGKLEEIKNGLIVDPFCGSGTLTLEAVAVSDISFGSRSSVSVSDIGFSFGNRFLAIDKNEHAVTGSKQNFETLIPDANWEVVQGNALEMDELVNENSVDLILADPPFGRHMGKKIRFSRFFGFFLSQVRKALKPEGRLVIRVLKRDSFVKSVDAIKGLEIEKQVALDQGGFDSYLFVLVKVTI